MSNPLYSTLTWKGRVGANVVIEADDFVACVGGYWVPVTSTTGLEGRIAKSASRRIDNIGGPVGAKTIDIEFLAPKHLHLVGNDTDANAVVVADIGSEVFWKDRKTITTDGTGRSSAGIAWGFAEFNNIEDTTRVWVEAK